jgi:hypothetical protein
MPMLADLDDPPSPRWKGLVFGFLLAIPVTATAGVFGLPVLRAAIVGSAQDFDVRLRQEDAYMQAVCTEALVIERDENLCACVLAVEVPALDCHGPFLEWSLERMHETCSDRGVADEAVAFCSCVDTLHDLVARAREEGPESAEVRTLVARYESCMALEDAASVHLPPIEALVSPTQ